MPEAVTIRCLRPLSTSSCHSLTERSTQRHGAVSLGTVPVTPVERRVWRRRDQDLPRCTTSLQTSTTTGSAEHQSADMVSAGAPPPQRKAPP